MLTDENEFLHTIAIMFVPIALQIGMIGLEGCEFIGGHRGIPGPSIAQRDLTSRLFEDVAGIRLAIEPTNALRSNNALRPLAGNEFIEESHIQGLTTIIYKGTDTVFLGFALIVIVMVVMVMIVTMMMLMVVVIVLLIIVVMMMVFFLIAVVVLYLINPCGRSGHLIKIEAFSVQYLIEIHIAVVALYDFCLRLDGTDDTPNTAQFFLCDLRNLVQEDDVAEFYLLDNQILDIVFIEVRAQQVVAAAEFITHSQCINYSSDAVHNGHYVSHVFESHRWNGTDGLCNGSGFAYSAGFDDNIVEAMLASDVSQLFYEIHLQRTADTPVLQGYQAVVFLGHYPTLFYEICINIHFTNIIHNDGEADAAAVIEYAV